MIRFSAARALAIVTLGAVFGWWLTRAEARKLARYEQLTPADLLAEVTQGQDSGLYLNVFAMVCLIALAFLGVELLARLYEEIGRGLRLNRERRTPPSNP